MDQLWYYWGHRDGKVGGPCAVQELRRLAQAGQLDEQDLVWPVGGDPRDGVLVEAALTTGKAAAIRADVPDWLADVKKVETHVGPDRQPWPVSTDLDWLDDLRALEGLPRQEIAPDSSSDNAESARRPGAADATAPTSSPANVDSVPRPAFTDALAVPPHLIPESMALRDVAPVATPTAPGAVTTGSAKAEGVRQKAPSRPAAAANASSAPEADVSRPERPGESVQEAYHRAQAALQRWADLDINRALILAGNMQALRQDVSIQSIVGTVHVHGPAIVHHFWRHVEFVVENRRKYFEAMARPRP
jgi:hypothetical protein